MYYQGDATNQITIGRDMGWGAIKKCSYMWFIVGNGGNLSSIQHYQLMNIQRKYQI